MYIYIYIPLYPIISRIATIPLYPIISPLYFIYGNPIDESDQRPWDRRQWSQWSQAIHAVHDMLGQRNLEPAHRDDEDRGVGTSRGKHPLKTWERWENVWNKDGK